MTSAWSTRPRRPDDPFLPFTGGDYTMLLIAALSAAGIGLVLRSRKVS